MPVTSVHCFANHRCGVGKTTLTYQVSAAYAAAHPHHKVLVFDTTESGDVSEMLMGGSYETRGRESLRRLIPMANVTHFFLRALAASSSASLSSIFIIEKLPQDGTSPLSNCFTKMTSSAKKTEKNMSISLEEFAIPLAYANDRVPSNMYLCPSGIDLDHSIAFSGAHVQDIIATVLECFRNVSGKWKVFIDTDTGAHGENGVYSTIALSLADFVFIPLHADMSDWYGAQILINDLRDLHNHEDSHAQVHLVLWNGLTVQQLKHACDGRSTGTFVPIKAEQDVLQTLDNHVAKEVERQPSLFVYKMESNDGEVDVKCSLCVGNFGVVGFASKDSGIPITCIKHGSFRGVHMTYTLNETVIKHCKEILESIVKSIDEVEQREGLEEDHERRLRIYKERTLERRLGRKVTKEESDEEHTPNSKRKKIIGGYGSGNSVITHLKPSDYMVYKIYALRNRYYLRDRTAKMRTKFFSQTM